MATMKKSIKIISILLAISTSVIVGGIVVLYFNFKLPTTIEMRNYFSSHQSEFENKNAEILAVLAAGGHVDSGGNAKVGYLGLQATSEPSAQIMYFTHRAGIGVGSFGTGIAYLESQPVTLYPSLEAMRDDGGKDDGFVGFGRLSGKWYFFFWGSH